MTIIPEAKEFPAKKFLRWLGQKPPSIFTLSELDTVPIWRQVDRSNLKSILDEHVNTYYSLARPRDGIRKKPKKEDLLSTRHLHVDLDPDDGADPKKELDRLTQLLTDKLPKSVPAPSAIITSGRGVQGLWTLSDDQLLPDAQDAVEQANLWLIEVLGAPSGTHNVDRILRLPGSWNALSKKKIEAGYQPAMADIIELNDNTYRLEDFGKPTTKQTLSPSTAGGGADDCTADPITIEELGPLREKYDLPIRITSLIGRGHPGAWLEDYERDFGKCKKDPNNRSDWVFDVCCNLLRFGVEEGEILGIMIDPKWPISAHCMDQGSPERAARRQIGRAKLRVLADPGSSTGGRGGNDGPRGVSLGMLARQPFDTDQKGRPLLTTLNTHRALARIPGLILRYNAFADVETVEGLGEEFDGILTDAAVRRLRYMIENKFGFKMPKDEYEF